VEKTLSLDVSLMSPPEVFKLMVGFIGPRPIGWISTISSEGLPNLAPYSFFNMVGNNPPTLLYSPALSRDGRRKDSLLNAEATKCFVHNVVTKQVAEKMNETAIEYPHGVSEFEKAGLTALPSLKVKAPRLGEAAINVECELLQVISLGDQPGNGQLVLGRAVFIHINDRSILDEKGLIDSSRLALIGRLGKNDYLDFVQTFSMPSLR
jgi:flavin reductase (DIM6/NTAB) family NADH-FMN oxidoreductase RutF